jgi:DNA transposition AAA+ family ATPase
MAKGLASHVDIDVEEVREQMRALVDGGVAQADVARAVGRSGASISQFLSGTYRGQNARLAAELRDYMRTALQRVAAGIGTADPAAVLNTEVYLRCKEVLHMARLHRNMGVIVGPAGVGKTLALQSYTADGLAVMVTALAMRGYPKAVLADICAELRLSTTGPASELMLRVRQALAGSDRLVIIDEAQHMQGDTLEVLRQLHDASHFGMVWVGNPTSIDRIRGGSRPGYEQIWSRIGPTYDMARKASAEPFRPDVESLAHARGWGDSECVDFLYRIARQGGWLRQVDKILQLAGRPPGEEVEPIDVLRQVVAELGWGGAA